MSTVSVEAEIVKDKALSVYEAILFQKLPQRYLLLSNFPVSRGTSVVYFDQQTGAV